MAAKGKWSRDRQSYDTDVYEIEFNFGPSGSNGSTVGFTGSTGVKAVYKKSPGNYFVQLKDKLQWAVPTSGITLLTGTQAGLHNVRVSFFSASQLYTSPTGTLYFNLQTGSLGAAVDMGNEGPVNAGGAGTALTDPGTKINIRIVGKIGTIK